ncbi:MAG: hypothetical protein ACI8X5_000534 [Planctomycetota bacterium]|jgi:hypothetical protein
MKRFSTRASALLPIFLFALLAITPPSALAGLEFQPVDDEIVKEFKKYFRKFKDSATRVEAIYSLEDADSPAMVKVLIPVLADSDPEVVAAAIKILGTLQNREAIDAIFIRLAEEKKEPIRLGLLMTIGEAGYQGDNGALIECLADKSWAIRYRTVQALEARGERSAIPAIVELTKDKESAIRSASIEALTTMKHEPVVEIAILALNDKIWQVRSSAAKALYVMRAKRSIDPLISRMEQEEGRLLEDYSKALEEITAKGYGLRTEMWRKWWIGIESRFEIPSDEALAKAKAKRAENRALYTPQGTSSYHGIETPSRSVIYIIDVSGSMENQVVEKERFKDGGYPSLRRIDIVKTELKRTIETLEPYVKLNILAFATDVKPWKKKLSTCNVLNKRSALDWVDRLEAIGGSSKEELAAVGLGGSANLEAGKTNTYGALMEALGVATRGSSGARNKSYEVSVDTIFFLSDGRPTVGELVDPNDILKEVRAANGLRKVLIHSIAIGEFQRKFMRDLAEENGGMFVDLGR